MLVSDIIHILEQLADPSWQEEYDNCGLLIGSAGEACSAVLVSLDVTPAVVEEAVLRGANLIVAHHPVIFRGLKQVSADTGTGRTVIAAIRNQVAVYAIHTSLDNVLPGVNSEIAARLGLTGGRPLMRKSPAAGTASRPGQVGGSGLIGHLPEPLGETTFLARLQHIFGTPVVKHSGFTGRSISRVAVCGGTGSFLITNALREEADAFVSADLKYHEFFDAEGKLLLADIGHFESEQFTSDFLVGEMRKKYPNFAVLKAETRTNPVHYYL